MFLVQGKNPCGKSCHGAGLPEELRGKLPSPWMMGVLGSKGTLSCFLTTFFFKVLPGCVLCTLEAVPSTGGRVKAAGTKEGLVRGEGWTGDDGKGQRACWSWVTSLCYPKELQV